MSKIKTRDVVKDVKTFDRAANLSQRMKDGAAKTKEAAEEQIQESRHESPAVYATDRMTEGGKIALHKARHMTRQPVRRMQKSSEELGRAARDAKRAYQELRTSGKTAKAAKGADGTKAAKGTQSMSSTKASRGAKSAKVIRGTKGAGPVKAPAEKTIRTTTKTVKETGKTIKTASKTTVKTAKTTGKAVKTSAGGAKIATKSTVLAAKSGAKATVTAAKMAKLSAIKAKAVAIKAKLIAKAVIATVKLAIAAIKSLIAIIMAGGWVAVVIILVIGLMGMLVASPFGIFFAGEDDPDYGLTMQEVVAELTTEFYAQIDDLAARYPHDELRIGGMTLRWNEILAVYAVRMTTDAEHGMDVVTLDEQRVAEIRRILEDMATLTATTHTEMREEIVLDEYDEEIVEYVPFVILTITLNHRTAMEMADYYGFDNEQRELLEELLDPEHMELWAMLLGGFAAGDGRVLTGNENFIPLGIFAWPLEGNWPVSSRFGPRPSPGGIGSTNHMGIDISAPIGTPILASAAGTVTQVRNTDQGGWGLFVIIDHGGGYQTIYAHNSRNSVSVGQTVVQGQVIAEIGSTGTSTGPHLHFEIRRNGVPVDPLGYFTW